MHRVMFRVILLCAALLVPSIASAQFATGSTGADGAFNPPAGTDTIKLSLAGTGPGTGTYDAAHWAIVFNYTTINIPANTTIVFTNHPSNAPVIWLATGNVTIDGTVNLTGSPSVTYTNGLFAQPGPGGFEGGRATLDPNASPPSNGFGPGGAPFSATYPGGGGYGTAGTTGSPNPGGGTYGDDRILPLIGGSGGGGFPSQFYYGGGAGGGAILIASPTSITISGAVSANGGQGYTGYGHGSGGAIRLRAPSISGNGLLRAYSGAGAGDGNGLGRLRVEATSLSLVDVGIPPIVATTTPNPIFPASNAPTLRAVSIGGTPIPTDPAAGIQTIDASIANAGAVTLQIEATNIAPGTTVQVMAQPDGGPTQFLTTPGLSGSLALSTTSVSILIDRIRRTEISLRANTP